MSLKREKHCKGQCRTTKPRQTDGTDSISPTHELVTEHISKTLAPGIHTHFLDWWTGGTMSKFNSILAELKIKTRVLDF